LTIVLVLATGGSAAAHHYDHLLAPTSKCGGSAQTDTGLPAPQQEMVMVCMHNHARAKVGRAALSWHSLLGRSSDAKTADMLRCGEFSHGACGRSTLYHVHRVGYTSSGCWSAWENIAWGSGSYATVRSRMSGWLHSDSHRPAILDSKYREVGFGMRRGTFQGRSGAHVWTAHLGRRC
jgi:uncharacterized protein YkwD